MIVLGVDPPNGWAVVDGDKLLGSAHWPKGVPDSRLAREIRVAVGSALKAGAEVLAIEGQWIEWRGSVPAKQRAGMGRSALVTAGHRGMWVQEWLRQSDGAPVEVLQPEAWRKPVLGTKGPKDRDARKDQAIRFMSALYGVKLSEDEAEAVGIARCVSISLRNVKKP